LCMNMVQHSSSSGEGNTGFDFSTPTAVMAILKTLRAHTEVSVSARNEIRDLIFSYTNSGGDEASLELIKDRLVSIGITPESIGQQSSEVNASQATKKELPKAGFSTGRVAPVFSGSFAPTPQAVESAKQIIEEPPKVDESPITPEVPKTNPVPAPATKTVNKIVPKIPNNQSSKIPVVSTRVQPEPKEQPKATVSIAQNPPKPATDEATIPTPPTASESQNTQLDTSTLLERIRIIKADINTRAGNPVNLVAMDDVVGREYMSSLLDAMKQLGGGNASSISGAMKRLEIAYEQALSVIEMSQTPPSETKINKSEIPAAVTPPTPVVPSVSKPTTTPVPTSVTVEPVVSVAKKPPSPPPQSAPAQTPPVAATPVKPKSEPFVTPTEVPVVDSHANPPLGVTRSVAPARPKPSTSVPMESSPADIMQASQPPSAIPIHSSKLTPAKSVAMARPLRKVEELPTIAEVRNRSESGNPLYTQVISDGLEQLLSEWTIFRKSGVFGTGPHGSNHPLFKKLAPLKIPLIIAGRFEGATEEVRQSITDYMNGWRYEQGIVYEKEETFEEYLRRVIQHIIDSQRK